MQRRAALSRPSGVGEGENRGGSMAGLNAHHEIGNDVLRRVDERVAERRIGFPGFSVVVDIVLICILGVLAYGLVRII
jgi:hypothetical protein